jgi:hypothetical protein
MKRLLLAKKQFTILIKAKNAITKFTYLLPIKNVLCATITPFALIYPKRFILAFLTK